MLKRIDQLKKEKGDLLLKVEMEEEMITNQLQRKLDKLQAEKVKLELTLEQEQEFMVNRLQKQLDEIKSKQSPLSAGSWKSGSLSNFEVPVAPNVVEVLRAEVFYLT